ncbi:hypothetical protein nbrc107696_13900 [Gordonia spumicola]|uniref:Transporter n=1 Tax=Gordonia spumicola TaxID=589161 RepID=A0A7I9V6T7_9ACTN|nr:transporter [Gordonia spumicola]GEE00944.1 hypothetical protein nbrc107696_13900 [Gordonia spumicola]
MGETLFLLADLLMIVAGYTAGWKFLRRYGNYLLGVEWLIVATSGLNFLIWALLGSNEHSAQYNVAFFFDAFSRSIGITLLLVVGLMRVTHRYKPGIAVDVALFALAIGAGLYLSQEKFRNHDLHVGPATFYLVANLLTLVFLGYFAWRLWTIGARRVVIATALVSLAATSVAVFYDFFPWSFDDESRSLFYAYALAVWGFQLWIYYLGYRALDDHNAAIDHTAIANDRTAQTVR